MAPIAKSAPPGFYPDPEDSSRERWWDGTSWATGPGFREPNLQPKHFVSETQALRDNQMALASFILSVSWIFFVGSILAVIFGHLAMSQIRRSNGAESGRGHALMGLVFGYAGIMVGLLVLIIILG